MQPLRNALKRSVSAPDAGGSNLVIQPDPDKTLQTLKMLSDMGYRNVWCKTAEVNAAVIQRAALVGWRICDAANGSVKFTLDPVTPTVERVSPTDKQPEPPPSPYARLARSGVSKEAASRLVDDLLGPALSPKICVSAPLEDESKRDESGSSYFTFKPARSRMSPLADPNTPWGAQRKSHLRNLSKGSSSSSYSQDSDMSSIREVPEPPSPTKTRRAFRPPTPELRIGQTRHKRQPMIAPLDRDNFFNIGAEDLLARRRRTAADIFEAAQPESPTLPVDSIKTLVPPEWRF